MRSRWGLGSLGFLSGLVLLGAGRAPINDIWVGRPAISFRRRPCPEACSAKTFALAGLSNAIPAQPTPQPPVLCPPPPTAYQTLPSIGGTGDVSVALALGAGPGIGDGNQNLCFVAGDLPAAPVIRIQQGNQLTVKLTNTLVDTGPDNTENCPIENYTGGPPVSNQCSQPEAGFKAAPGPDGTYYPIQTNIPMLADGTTNFTFTVSRCHRCHAEMTFSTAPSTQRTGKARWTNCFAARMHQTNSPTDTTSRRIIQLDFTFIIRTVTDRHWHRQ